MWVKNRCPILGANYLKFDWFVPKTGLRSFLPGFMCLSNYYLVWVLKPRNRYSYDLRTYQVYTWYIFRACDCCDIFRACDCCDVFRACDCCDMVLPVSHNTYVPYIWYEYHGDTCWRHQRMVQEAVRDRSSDEYVRTLKNLFDDINI